MPKRTDLKSILILGAGPIVIGQACEFDYSGVQACKALGEEGYRIILVNSNPATIMTDPKMADATYIEPIQWDVVRTIIEKERPDAVLPTMGGQTALNCALALEKHGVCAEFGVEMIGATADAIDKAENRSRFDKAMKSIGFACPNADTAKSMIEAYKVLDMVGFPCIIRPSFTMGGTGGGIAYNKEEFEEICHCGLDLSPTNELLIDESLIGWKEYEMEVVRDKNNNCIIVCTIENFDVMGIHTGDSITIVPAQTLTDKEYQLMRNASFAILREIGVETGGANVQFGINPKNGRMVIIEMNPRVSRSSALASKATGFPIAKIAAKLAVGFTLDELMNDITGGTTPASFEPTIDYVVTKIPRFNFEKFVGANDRLTTQMKSIGEVMAIGRNQQESLQKALRGLEVGVTGFDEMVLLDAPDALTKIRHELKDAGAERIWYIADAFRAGMSVPDIFKLTNIDSWFLVQIEEIVKLETKIKKNGFTGLNKDVLRKLKRKGFADARLSKLLDVSESEIRKLRDQFNIHPVYKRIDTYAAEFPSNIAYMYSTYDEECESNPTDQNKIIVLGGGPNRIGQGIEFDYCCVHASLALREDGYETIMVNCNPETVSTDYDMSDRLYFEPVTLEDVLAITRVEKPKGVIVQYGGQTPLKLARELEMAGVPIIGTSPDAIDRAENRKRFQTAVNHLGLKTSENDTATTVDQAIEKSKKIGFPLVVRPSYVLGGRAMEIVYDENHLRHYFIEEVSASNESPVLLDRFLDDAIEVDVDAICDGYRVVIGGIMEHIEQAGVHSGDSACSLPAYTLSQVIQSIIRQQVKKLAFELGVRGLMNTQFAVKDNEVYLIEVNPRAARTIPFVSKSTGVPLAKIAARVMVGQSLESQGFTQEIIPPYHSVKEVVLPFNKFPGVDPLLGPEMRSTGEVMGVGDTFAEAFAKADLGCGKKYSAKNRALLSVRNNDKQRIVDLAKKLIKLGFKLDATHGTAVVLGEAGINFRLVNKVHEGRPHVLDRIKNGEYNYIVNTTEGRQAIEDSKVLRRGALAKKVNYTTTLNAAFATCMAYAATNLSKVNSVQELHERIAKKYVKM
ncbi:carbamoyl-phosphate synthase large subunit [Candidatus Enterovibrio altilux]|uniref:Carbamoyl phosphate synthase large chain n=1 Tax=Candidatus Enterovibrio altilux TaxID=1927128 RepID=A0A291BA62_9GAMM|nr:carbamoyl-phosphate synthase large subunit [Candidatus Enterovibrio luxaltus]ATF09909.1 Carbamoyl-phosphate synthase large chain [Candidatus Enterovibrio luxaltus]